MLEKLYELIHWCAACGHVLRTDHRGHIELCPECASHMFDEGYTAGIEESTCTN
jgi:Zn finger protein HypA/HybF involved in hydrogenase expression